MTDSIISPFGIGHVDLKGILLTCSQKQWLGQQILQHHYTYNELARCFNISEGVLGKYKNQASKTCSVNSNGRPPVLDKISIDHIKLQMFESSEMPRNDLKILIKAEAFETRKRHVEVEMAESLSDSKKMNSSTLRRYCRRFEDFHSIQFKDNNDCK
jgi:hypothetical protein